MAGRAQEAHAQGAAGRGIAAIRKGQVVVGHRLLRALGQGAHGQVFLAQPVGGGAPVALKLVPLPPAGASIGAGVGAGVVAGAAHAAFVAAAATAQRLRHPGIVEVRDFGIAADTGWLTMEPVPGTDLVRYTQALRLLPEPLLLHTAERLARALAHAHAQGVVHRDLKPANVLVHWPSATVKLGDFGIARAADAARTATGLVPGTPAYMAPELLAGAVPTPQSDLYALGVMLFELCSARRPHQGDSMGELLQRVATEPAPDLAALCPDAAPAVAPLVARLLAKKPGARPASADAVADALLAIREGLQRTL